MRQAREQSEIVIKLRSQQVTVGYDYEMKQAGVSLKDGSLGYGGIQVRGAVAPAPEWLRRAVGDDFFGRAIYVSYARSETVVDVTTGRDTRLHRDVDGADIDLAFLQGLKDLQYLNLEDSRATDDDLEHVKSMRQLRSINLEGTQTTFEGTWRLRKALPKLNVVQ
jgi:hypothetical protein